MKKEHPFYGKNKVFKVLTIPNKGALYEYCKHLSLTLDSIASLTVTLHIYFWCFFHDYLSGEQLHN